MMHIRSLSSGRLHRRINYSGPLPKFLSGLEKGTRLFLFATHGAAAGSDHVKNGIQQAREIAPEVNCAGVFTCQGEVSPKVLEKVKQKNPPPPWIGDAKDAVGHPDAADLARLAEMVKTL